MDIVFYFLGNFLRVFVIFGGTLRKFRIMIKYWVRSDDLNQSPWSCPGCRTQKKLQQRCSVLLDYRGHSLLSEIFQGCSSQSNLVFLNIEWIHSLSFSVETTVKPCPQSNISFDFNFEVKTFLKYIGWFNLVAFIIKIF